MKRIGIFMGTRPEGIKLAPVEAALRASKRYDVQVINTGQHREMLGQVIDLFGIKVDHDLAVMTQDQTLASLTAILTTRIDEFLKSNPLDFTIVQGDTTTVMVAALTSFYNGIPTGHVEAGLRTASIASPFPEEANRRLTTQLTELHFAPTEVSRQNLLNGGVADEKIFVTGNTVIDALLQEVEAQSAPAVEREINTLLAGDLGPNWFESPYVLVTGHRRESFGEGFDSICNALKQLALKYPNFKFIYPVHLNPRVQEPVNRTLGDVKNIHLISPQPYRPFVRLMRGSHVILTDSGGVQEEAPSLGKPVLVMRDNTERPEGVDAGTVKLIGPHTGPIVDELSRLIDDEEHYRSMANARNPYGDGKGASRIVKEIDRWFEGT